MTRQVLEVKKEKYLEYECQLVKVAKNRQGNRKKEQKLVGSKRLRANVSESDSAKEEEEKADSHANFLEMQQELITRIIYKSNLEQLKALVAEVEKRQLLNDASESSKFATKEKNSDKDDPIVLFGLTAGKVSYDPRKAKNRELNN